MDMTRGGTAAFVFVLAGACASAPVTARNDRRVSTGDWGGEHIQMTVTASGAHLEFDCASGDIATPLVVDETGQLTIEGVYIPERPGAVRIGDEPDRKAVRYSGRLAEKTLVLDVTLIESKDTIGHFTMTLDLAARVRKCR